MIPGRSLINGVAAVGQGRAVASRPVDYPLLCMGTGLGRGRDFRTIGTTVGGSRYIIPAGMKS